VYYGICVIFDGTTIPYNTTLILYTHVSRYEFLSLSNTITAFLVLPSHYVNQLSIQILEAVILNGITTLMDYT